MPLYRVQQLDRYDFVVRRTGLTDGIVRIRRGGPSHNLDCPVSETDQPLTHFGIWFVDEADEQKQLITGCAAVQGPHEVLDRLAAGTRFTATITDECLVDIVIEA